MKFIFFSDGKAEKKNKISFVFGLLLLVGLFLLVVILPKVYACSCVSDTPIEDRVAEKDIIFSGKVLEKVEKGDKKIFVFEIEKLWKNNSDRKLLENNNMTVYTPSNEGLCGTDFTNNLSYLVYANMYKGDISTSMCSGNDRLFLKNADLEYLASYDEDGSYTLEEGQCFEGQKIVDGKCYPPMMQSHQTKDNLEMQPRKIIEACPTTHIMVDGKCQPVNYINPIYFIAIGIVSIGVVTLVFLYKTKPRKEQKS